MLILLILSYLLGSVNSALIVCKLFKLPSPYTQGSKNPGATNVLRIGGKKAAALTLIGDMLKGALPVCLGHALHLPLPNLAWIGFFAVLGHVYPLFHDFKGGKGVATAIGMSFAVQPLLGACIALTWLLLMIVFRYSSLASLVSLTLSPLYAGILENAFLALPFGCVALLIIIKHQRNLKNLLRGTEPKLGKTA